MRNLSLNKILIPLSFYLLATLLLFITSNLILPILFYTLAIGFSLFYLKQDQKKENDLSIVLDEFLELLDFERNKIDERSYPKESLGAKMMQVIDRYAQQILDDTQVAGETVLISDKVKKGHFELHHSPPRTSTPSRPLASDSASPPSSSLIISLTSLVESA